jgi:predicted GNAT superfamily acetyltransferase
MDDLSSSLVELNDAAVPAVSVADVERMVRLTGRPRRRCVGGRRRNVEGWTRARVSCVLFEPGSVYDSANYRWFAERFDAVPLRRPRRGRRAGQRGGGIWGATLYDAVAAEAVAVVDRVGSWPRSTSSRPNPARRDSTDGIGFEAIGEQRRFSDDYVVEMLERPVPGGRRSIRSTWRSS